MSSAFLQTILDVIGSGALKEADLLLIANAVDAQREPDEDDEEEAEPFDETVTAIALTQLTAVHRVVDGWCLQDMTQITTIEDYGRHLAAATLAGDGIEERRSGDARACRFPHQGKADMGVMIGEEIR